MMCSLGKSDNVPELKIWNYLKPSNQAWWRRIGDTAKLGEIKSSILGNIKFKLLIEHPTIYVK